MSRIFPTPYTVAHISRQLDKTQKDSHGNYLLDTSTPVIRQAQSITQFGRRGSSREVFSTQTAERQEIMLHMAVDNPEVYKSGDQVLIGGSVDDTGAYVNGTAYWVDGDPADERNGPWPRYTRLFGGIVKLRRIT